MFVLHLLGNYSDREMIQPDLFHFEGHDSHSLGILNTGNSDRYFFPNFDPVLGSFCLKTEFYGRHCEMVDIEGAYDQLEDTIDSDLGYMGSKAELAVC